MVKKIALLIVLGMVFGFGMAQTSEKNESKTNWENVKVVYDQNEVADMTRGTKMTETIETSLNFGTKSKFERQCLKNLKQQAAEKGYQIIYVDEDASSNKRFNKRGIKITLVGRGYK